MRTNRLFASLLALPLALLPVAARAQAAPATVAVEPGAAQDAPGQFIQQLAEQALNSINGKRLSDDETQGRFRTLLRQSFDLKAIGRFVLGRYYNAASEQQRSAYQQAFENMIVDAYATRFRDYSGGSFKIGKEVTNGNDTSVSSQILQNNGAPPINVNWRVRKEGDGLKVVDVAVEGVSMSMTEKSEFASVIDRNGGNVQALIDAINNHQIGVPDGQK